MWMAALLINAARSYLARPEDLRVPQSQSLKACYFLKKAGYTKVSHVQVGAVLCCFSLRSTEHASSNSRLETDCLRCNVFCGLQGGLRDWSRRIGELVVEPSAA
jgi:rhodanese-related sulfurtransferase